MYLWANHCSSAFEINRWFFFYIFTEWSPNQKKKHHPNTLTKCKKKKRKKWGQNRCEIEQQKWKKIIEKFCLFVVRWFDKKREKKNITLERIKSPRVIQLFVRMVLTVYHYDTIESRVMAVQPLCNLLLMVHHEQPMNPMDVPQCEAFVELQRKKKQKNEKKTLLLLLLKAFKCVNSIH